jgi:hypothetical protein
MSVIGRVLAAILFLASLAASPASAATYCTEFLSSDPPALVNPGQLFSVHVQVRNCGSLVWTTKDPNRVYLVYHWYQDGKLVQWDGGRVLGQAAVASTETANFTIAVKAPTGGGVYTLRWDLVHVDASKVAHWFSKAGAATKEDTVTVFSPVIVALVASMTPTINFVYFPVLKPEQEGLIFGNWLGKDLGQVKVELPSGKITNAVVLKWTHHIIYFKMPPISGEKDGPSRIWIEPQNAMISNKYNINFNSTKELLNLKPKNLMNVAKCADPFWSWDECTISESLIIASHHTWCCFSADSGADIYNFLFPLKNGWTIASVDLDWWSGGDWEGGNCIGSCASVKLAQKIAPQKNEGQFIVHWDTGTVGPNFLYSISIDILGPKGVSYVIDVK